MEIFDLLPPDLLNKRPAFLKKKGTNHYIGGLSLISLFFLRLVPLEGLYFSSTQIVIENVHRYQMWSHNICLELINIQYKPFVFDRRKHAIVAYKLGRLHFVLVCSSSKLFPEF